MKRAIAKVVGLIIMLTMVAGVGGCATADRKVDILYRPAANVKGGSGDLYLIQGVRPPSGQAAGIQWVLGAVTEEDGKKIGKIVTDTAPANLVMDALSRELRDAGYNVLVAGSMPEHVSKGLRLSEVTMKLDDIHYLTKDEANCAVKTSIEPWRQGSAVSTLRYEADYSNTSVTGRDELPSETLQKALQLMMSRAVPEIVKALEGK